MDFVHDLLVVVVTDGTAELVVVHVWLAFACPPHHGDGLGVQQLELPVASHPRDDVGVLLVLKELKQKLPELNLTWRWRKERKKERLEDLLCCVGKGVFLQEILIA